jgi:hypothetical protein
MLHSEDDKRQRGQTQCRCFASLEQSAHAKVHGARARKKAKAHRARARARRDERRSQYYYFLPTVGFCKVARERVFGFYVVFIRK